MNIFSTDDLQEAIIKADEWGEDVWDSLIGHIPTDYGSPGRYVAVEGLSNDPELIEELDADDWVLVS